MVCHLLGLSRTGMQPLHRRPRDSGGEEHHGQGQGAAAAQKGQHEQKIGCGRLERKEFGITVILRIPLRYATRSETVPHGQGGIRTLDTLAGMPPFQGGAFNRSATCPEALSGRNLAACESEVNVRLGL